MLIVKIIKIKMNYQSTEDVSVIPKEGEKHETMKVINIELFIYLLNVKGAHYIVSENYSIFFSSLKQKKSSKLYI